MCRTPTNLVPAMVQRPGGRHDRKRIHNNIIECAMEWDSIYNRARSIMWYMYKCNYGKNNKKKKFVFEAYGEVF